MSLLHRHQEPPNPSKKCNFFKDALATFCRKISLQTQQEQEDDDVSNYDDDEQEVFVSAVVSRYMEAKSKRKVGVSFIYDELLPNKKEIQDANASEIDDEFYSSCSHLSRCSSVEAFISVKSNLSRCSSMSSIEFRSIIREFCHCEGWPFGLCRKALLVPPLPKSPSESWLWRKTKIP